MDPHIGERIRLHRLMLGMSQAELAEGLSVSFQQVQKYENGTDDVSAGKLPVLAALLHVPIDYFFEELNYLLEEPMTRRDEQKPAAGVSQPSIIGSFLISKSGARLARAFPGIPELQIRQIITLLVNALAARSDPMAAG